jgi:Domain of unknown function (DUF4886)
MFYRIFFFILLITLMKLSAQSQQIQPLRVLLVGNSFSQNASRYLPQIAAEKGRQIIFGHAEPGGCSLQRHWDSVAAYLQDTARGKLYGGKSLMTLLQQEKWDVVTIQQYSLLSGDSNTYEPYAKKLFDFIKKVRPGAEVLVHQTWAYRADAINFGKIEGEKRAASQQQMWQYSRAAYHALARKLGLRIIPSGDAFYAASIDSQWGFKKDTQFNADTAKTPALPDQHNALNIGYAWTKDGKLNFDPNHANEAGCYLAGLVWYAILFNESPVGIKFHPATVSDPWASFLQQTAWKAAQKSTN